MKKIIDISHHQDPSKLNYNKLASQISLVIIRTQYGSQTIDKHYKTHHREFQKRGVPTAAYAWVRGSSIGQMITEATYFYQRTKEFNPTFWFLDIEERSMKDMRSGVKAYVQQLRQLGVKKIGAYIAHHLYNQLNLDLSDFDAIWIPRYGPNNGKQHNIKPDYPCDLWQYTDKGQLDGYSGYLDLNTLIGTKPLEFFTRKEDKMGGIKDIPSSWAKEAWDWAVKNEITDGTDPKASPTREEVVTMLYRYHTAQSELLVDSICEDMINILNEIQKKRGGRKNV